MHRSVGLAFAYATSTTQYRSSSKTPVSISSYSGSSRPRRPMLDQPHDRAEHGGLARAVRAEERDGLALTDVQCEVADDVVAPVARIERSDLECVTVRAH
jgi:hypothetical protein